MIEEAENFAAPNGTFRECYVALMSEIMRPKRFSSYVVLMRKIINSESSSVIEALERQVWKMPWI